MGTKRREGEEGWQPSKSKATAAAAREAAAREAEEAAAEAAETA
eukprot:SAG31_NODE_17063_length_684_cov_2.817094_1_plen_43_part_01